MIASLSLVSSRAMAADEFGHQHRPNVILSGVSTGHHTRGGEPAYSQYVRHLEKSSPAVQASQTKGTVEHFAQGYQDYLQAPLQVNVFPRKMQTLIPNS